MQRTLRTFIAAEISSEVRTRTQKLIDRLRGTAAKVKWVEPENLHFTLKFLGDVELLDVPAVCRAVTAAVADLPPFEIETRGAGAFPTLERPRTVWLGVGRGAEEMVELNTAIERALVPLGFRREARRFRPHLTIGRVRGVGPGIAELGRVLAEQADYLAGIASVDEVTVYSSELDRDGPSYEVLSTAELNG